MQDSNSKPIAPRKSRSERVADRIAKLAQRLGPDSKLPTVNELCASMDVSRGTLDVALGMLEQRQLISRRRGSGIFTPPIAKRSLLPIMMGVDPLSQAVSPFYRLLTGALRKQAESRKIRSDLYAGFSSATETSDGRWDRSPAEQLLRKLIDENLVMGGMHVTGWGVDTYFQERGLPVVGVGSNPKAGMQLVGINIHELMRLGIEALQQHGRTRIAVIGGPVLGEPIIMPGACAFYDYGVAQYPNEENGYRLGCQVADRLHKKPGDLDGLVITDDVFARGVLTGLARAGVALGRDLMVASHVNKGSSMLVGFQHDLIALEVDPADFAATMFELLDAQIAGAQGGRLELVCPRVIHP